MAGDISGELVLLSVLYKMGIKQVGVAKDRCRSLSECK